MRTQVWHCLGVCVNLAGCLNPLLSPVTLVERLEREWCSQGWEHPIPFESPTPWTHTTWGFTPSTHKHPPRPSQQVAPTQCCTHPCPTSTVLSRHWELKTHRKATVGQEESETNPWLMPVCVQQGQPRWSPMAGAGWETHVACYQVY